MEGKEQRMHYRYDSLDRRIETITPLEEHYRIYRDGEGYIQKEIHPNAYQRGTQEEVGVSYEHDKGHHQIRIYSLEGGIERRFYDEEGNLVAERYETKEIREEEPNTEYEEIWYFYDENGHVERIEDGYGVCEKYAYDCLGNRIYEERLIEEGIVQKKIDYYFDIDGKPIGKNSDPSHIVIQEEQTDGIELLEKIYDDLAALFFGIEGFDVVEYRKRQRIKEHKKGLASSKKCFRFKNLFKD